jgi:O-antigen ligase
MVISCSSKDFPLGTLGYAVLWLTLAISSIVLIEPAPCDLLAVGLLPLLFVFGLRVPTGFSAPFLCIVTYVAGYGLSGLFAASFADAVTYLLITAYLSLTFLVYTCIIYHRPVQSLNVIMSGYLVAAVFAATFGIMTYFGWVPNAAHYLAFGTRVKALFKDPNVFGPFLVTPAMYLVATMIDAKLDRALLCLGVFLLLAFGVFLSFSRGAWANLAIAFFLFLTLSLLATRSRQQTSRLIGFGVATLALAVTGVVLALSMHKVDSLFQVRASLLQNYDTAAQGRFAMQHAAFELAAGNPFGIGPGQWERFFPEDPHNVYVKLIATGGWVTGLAYYSLVLVTLWRGLKFCFASWSGQLVYIAFYSAFVATVLEGAIIDTDHWRSFYLLLALVWGPALAIKSRQRSAERNRWLGPAGVRSRRRTAMMSPPSYSR